MANTANKVKEVHFLKKTESTDFLYFTELVSFCPHCKSLQTLLFSQGELVSKHKYSQHDGHVYHDCGSDIPCRFL